MHFRPITLFCAGVLAIGLSLSTGAAQTASPPAEQLFAALKLPEILGVMREEGIAYGAKIGDDLFPGAIDPDWSAQVEMIYDTERMQAQALAAFTAGLEGADVAAMLAFFTTEPGQSFAALELSARTALLDEAVETESKQVAAVAMSNNSPRYQQVIRFADANDLIETNVVGALNSNYAFYQGLMQGGAMQQGLTEDEVLASVWDQEAEIRQTTTEWVVSFLLLAYQPLTDADIEAYIRFSQTPAGEDLNRAAFGAFDGIFTDISKALGVASARYMVGDTL